MKETQMAAAERRWREAHEGAPYPGMERALQYDRMYPAAQAATGANESTQQRTGSCRSGNCEHTTAAAIRLRDAAPALLAAMEEIQVWLVAPDTAKDVIGYMRNLALAAIAAARGTDA